MGGDRLAVRSLGLLILAVVGVGGFGALLVFSGLAAPRLDVALLFLPWAVATFAGMALLWIGTALVVLLRTRSQRRS